MQNARIFRTASADDIYAGIQREENRLANYRRATQPALRAQRVDAEPVVLVQVVESQSAPEEAADPRSAAPAQSRQLQEAPTREEWKPAPKSSAAQSCDTIPAHSMRRMKAAKRVVGVPETIEEEISASVLRDPRRE